MAVADLLGNYIVAPRVALANGDREMISMLKMIHRKNLLQPIQYNTLQYNTIYLFSPLSSHINTERKRIQKSSMQKIVPLSLYDSSLWFRRL